jgi:hypothetical protein
LFLELSVYALTSYDVTGDVVNGLLFGNPAKGLSLGFGSTYDVNVQVLSSATVKVKGKIKDDSA